MTGSNRHWAMAWLLAALGLLLAPSVRAEPAADFAVTQLVVRWVDIPQQVQNVCDKLSSNPPVNAAAIASFGCNTTYWVSPNILRMGKLGAPASAFRPAAGTTLCDAVKVANRGHDKDLEPLLQACGYVENPQPLVNLVCNDDTFDVAIAAAQANVIALTAKKPKGSADAAALIAAKGTLATAQANKAKYAPAQQKICGSVGNDRGDWDRAAQLPICNDIVDLELPVSSFLKLQARCKQGSLRSGIASPAAFLTPVLQGLGDFLQARAKEELVTFAVEQLGRKFCESSSKKLHGEVLFPETCSVLFPKDDKGQKGDANIDAITSGRFQKALARDLAHLPMALFEHEGYAFAGVEEKQLGVIFEQVVKALVNAAPKQDKVLDFFVKLESDTRAALTKGGIPLVCHFVYDPATEKVKSSVPCGMMLFLSAAAQARPAVVSASSTTGGVFAVGGAWLETSAVAFCTNYGAPGFVTGAKCLDGGIGDMHPEVATQLRAALDGVVAFYNDLVAVAKTLDDAKHGDKLSAGVMVGAASDVASAIHGLTNSLVTFAKVYLPLIEGTPAERAKAQGELDRINQVLDVVDEIFKAVAAATNQDYKVIAASLRIVFDSPLIASNINPEFKEGMFFVFDIAEAKDRDAVRKVFEDHASPVGSYRAKYKAMTTRINVNGMVGFLTGVQAPLMTHPEGMGYKALDLGVLPPLSAPVGIDISGPAIDGKNHLGVMFTVIDPLALRVTSTTGQPVQVDLDGVFTPGAFFRWGIWKSPVVFMIGVRAQPLLKSVERTCGASNVDKACWQAPISGLAGFAIDLPIFSLN